MNETENRQKSESTNEEKNPRKTQNFPTSNKEWYTKETGSKELGNERISDVIEKLSFAIYELKDSA